MGMKEIDLSHGDEYTCNVDLTKEELDWVYAYLQLTDDTGEVGRETLAKVCKNVEGMNADQTLYMRLVMWTASKLLREGAKKVRVTADDWSTAHPVTDGRDCATVGRGSCKAYVATVVNNSKENSPFKGIHQLTDEEAERLNPVKTIADMTDEQVERIKASFLKDTLNSVYGASATKLVHPDEDCVLPGCDRYGGNDTYLRIRKVLGHKGAFDFCMGNVVKLVDRWDKKGDPVENLEKLRDYSAQALVEWRLYNEMLS